MAEQTAIQMDLVLQAQIGNCPAVPGADLDFGLGLLQMSVVGIPLLLALFQFINDHEYPEPKDCLGLQSVIYGIAMGLSAFVLLGLYLVASCVIIAEVGINVLTILLLIFWWVLFVIIDRILSIQLRQMLRKNPRVSLICYLGASGLFVIAILDVFPADGRVRWGAVIIAVIVAAMGRTMQKNMRSVPDEQAEAMDENAETVEE